MAISFKLGVTKLFGLMVALVPIEQAKDLPFTTKKNRRKANLFVYTYAALILQYSTGTGTEFCLSAEKYFALRQRTGNIQCVPERVIVAFSKREY